MAGGSASPVGERNLGLRPDLVPGATKSRRRAGGPTVELDRGSEEPASGLRDDRGRRRKVKPDGSSEEPASRPRGLRDRDRGRRRKVYSSHSGSEEPASGAVAVPLERPQVIDGELTLESFQQFDAFGKRKEKWQNDVTQLTLKSCTVADTEKIALLRTVLPNLKHLNLGDVAYSDELKYVLRGFLCTQDVKVTFTSGPVRPLHAFCKFLQKGCRAGLKRFFVNLAAWGCVGFLVGAGLSTAGGVVAAALVAITGTFGAPLLGIGFVTGLGLYTAFACVRGTYLMLASRHKEVHKEVNRLTERLNDYKEIQLLLDPTQTKDLLMKWGTDPDGFQAKLKVTLRSTATKDEREKLFLRCMDHILDQIAPPNPEIRVGADGEDAGHSKVDTHRPSHWDITVLKKNGSLEQEGGPECVRCGNELGDTDLIRFADNSGPLTRSIIVCSEDLNSMLKNNCPKGVTNSVSLGLLDGITLNDQQARLIMKNVVNAKLTALTTSEQSGYKYFSCKQLDCVGGALVTKGAKAGSCICCSHPIDPFEYSQENIELAAKLIEGMKKQPSGKSRNGAGVYRPCYHCGITVEKGNMCSQMDCGQCKKSWDIVWGEFPPTKFLNKGYGMEGLPQQHYLPKNDWLLSDWGFFSTYDEYGENAGKQGLDGKAIIEECLKPELIAAFWQRVADKCNDTDLREMAMAHKNQALACVATA